MNYMYTSVYMSYWCLEHIEGYFNITFTKTFDAKIESTQWNCNHFRFNNVLISRRIHPNKCLFTTSKFMILCLPSRNNKKSINIIEYRSLAVEFSLRY
jgi:hypothetical protein